MAIGVAFGARTLRRLARAARRRRERRLAGGAALAARRLRRCKRAARARCRCRRSGSPRSRSARVAGGRARASSSAADARCAGRLPRAGVAPPLAGAALAAALFQWLHLRAKATLPAETTARLAELQSRIRPHFLFNTLNTALALVRLDPARAEGVLEDLAELFRVALTDAASRSTLADEVELARRYLAIEQIRFGERLQVAWELDPAAAGARVPPLLLQPLVENAVRHGVEPSPDGGTIRMRTRVKRGRAVVTIANSVPATPSRPGHGMALKNVRERLRLMHDVAAQFEARRGPDVFHVQIVVPL